MRALEGLDGVETIGLDFEKQEFSVSYDPSRITTEDMLGIVRAKGYTASLDPPAAPLAKAPPLSEEERARLDIQTVSHGEAIQIGAQLVADKYTIVDYYADWCGPCLLLAHQLERVLAERSDVALRKVDIVTWKTAAAKQVTGDYGIEGIPYVRVYDPSGDFVGAVEGNDVDKVRALLAEQPPSAEQ